MVSGRSGRHPDEAGRYLFFKKILKKLFKNPDGARMVTGWSGWHPDGINFY